ncbi:MAG: ABC transporter permease [Acidimicrobiales bacterium]
MSSVAYTRIEVLRTFRNGRFFILSLAFPLVLFFFVAGANRHKTLGGISFPLYYMVGMASWGAMAAVMSGGARIALERSVGWTRQMRITPLSVYAYFQSKVLSSYLMAIVSLVLLYAAGLSLGVHMATTRWLEMTGLLIVGLIPFVVLGILLGHLLTVDSMGPALGGIVAVFALLGGSYGPLATSGALHSIAENLPSYWLVQAGYVALGAGAWPAHGWIVLGVWSVVLLRFAFVVYRRDTARV